MGSLKEGGKDWELGPQGMERRIGKWEDEDFLMR